MDYKNDIPPEIKFEEKYVQLKSDKATNCRFVEGDILNLNKVTNGEKADVITFSNALYHLTTDDVGTGIFRIPKQNREEIIRNVAIQVKENLNPNGIFVLGEGESAQMLDTKTVPKVFKSMGFEALNETLSHEANVYRLM